LAFASGAQQLSAARASSALPQHVPVLVSPAVALPQQPPADGGRNASAGSPANPPALASAPSMLVLVVVMIASSGGYRVNG
jgi:hypothetical protein